MEDKKIVELTGQQVCDMVSAIGDFLDEYGDSSNIKDPEIRADSEEYIVRLKATWHQLLDISVGK